MPQVQQNLLSMVQTATQEMGLPVPTAVASASDTQTMQLFGLIKRELRELQQCHPWTFLQTQFIVEVAPALETTGDVLVSTRTILNVANTTGIAANTWIVTGDEIAQAARVTDVTGTTVTTDMEATGTQVGSSLTFVKDTYTIPTDFDYYIGGTWWDRTNRWQLLGPDSPQIDQYHRSGIVQTGPRLHWRQFGTYFTNFRLWPQPSATATAPQQLVFEYINANAVVTVGGVAEVTFMADTDIPLVDSNALILGLKWRFMQANRMQFGDLQAEYLDYVDRLKARDGGNQILSMAPRVGPDYLISPASVPDGNYPS